MLCDSYAPALRRDPSYHEYLTRIGELYFGLESPRRQRGGGFLGQFLRSFLEDDDGGNGGAGISTAYVGNSNGNVSSNPTMSSANDELD